jgi:ADP-ribosyl-[dinitrogen reductase] hydrolase
MPALVSRITGALLGHAAGDALGATVEFLTPEEIRERYGVHRDVVGGGAFHWRPGEGTDDTDLTVALARVYVDGYTATRAADAFLDWYEGEPRDVGGMTAHALSVYAASGDPYGAGVVAAREVGPDHAAGNGSLMRALPTALVRTDAEQRRAEAVEVSAITHADERCTQACAAYADLVALLLDEVAPREAVERVIEYASLRADVRDALARGLTASLDDLDTSGYVLSALSITAWALGEPLEDALVAIVNRGGDTDTNAAIAGGALGAAHGVEAVPDRWTTRLEYAAELRALAPWLAAARGPMPE